LGENVVEMISKVIEYGKAIRLIQNDEPTSNQNRAREIMGKNFVGVEEAIKHFGVNPTRQQLAALLEIPFSEAMLQQSKDTHVLAAVFPLSILEIRDKVENKLFYNHEAAWYNEQFFAKERGEVKWQLVRKTPVANSTSKNQEQQALFSKDDPQLKRWSTRLLATSCPLMGGWSNKNMPVHLRWIQMAIVSMSQKSVWMASVLATIGMLSATTMKISRLLGSSDRSWSLKLLLR
jgi:hypothetical protein